MLYRDRIKKIMDIKSPKQFRTYPYPFFRMMPSICCKQNLTKAGVGYTGLV